MNYYKADDKQLEEISSIYANAVIAMDNDGICQWDEIYPSKQILMEDIRKRQMYIGKESHKIAICFVLSEEYDEEYKNGKWEYPNSKFIVLHRLCVSPEFQHKGIAYKTMNYIEQLCKTNGYDTIRLDCFTENPYSRRLYDKTGYKVRGYAEWRKGRFELREKKL